MNNLVEPSNEFEQQKRAHIMALVNDFVICCKFAPQKIERVLAMNDLIIDLILNWEDEGIS